MTEKEAFQALTNCKNTLCVCKVSFINQNYDEFFFIMSVSDELFVGVTERDFTLDGYMVRRLNEVSCVEAIRGTYLKIHQSEGNLTRLCVPAIDIKNFKSVINSLVATAENIIIEGNIPDSNNKFFFIGRALSAGNHGFRFRSFDGGGNWSDKTITVPYASLTSVTIASSYVTTYSKYVKPYPEIVTQKVSNNR